MVDAVSTDVVAGLLFDYQHSYDDTFLFAGLTMAFSGLVALLPRLRRRVGRINCTKSPSFALPNDSTRV